jgi:RNA polymerase subunit RPABC4/transcription elongation factor Spt4
MRYCNQCHRITAGEPLFCNFCGRSYDFKLCPHRHPNPRNAEICSQCGSRELSTPQPHVSFLLTPLVTLLSLLPGLLLALVSVSLAFGIIQTVLSSQQLMLQAVVAGFILCFLWYLYLHLPHFLRRLLSRLFTRSKRDNHDH